MRLKTPDECEAFARNVEKNHPNLAKEARRRAVELKAAQYGAKTVAEQEALQAVYAFETVRSQEAGKRVRASRTWQSVKQHGILPTVERVVARKQPSDAYATLIDAGMEDFTFEAVVLRHEGAFSGEAVEQAKKRIDERNALLTSNPRIDTAE